MPYAVIIIAITIIFFLYYLFFQNNMNAFLSHHEKQNLIKKMIHIHKNSVPLQSIGSTTFYYSHHHNYYFYYHHHHHLLKPKSPINLLSKSNYFAKKKKQNNNKRNNLGLYSVYTNWRSIEIMFHVSTLLPYEKHDPQKLQRKRHIGNDIVCVVFLEADNTPFSPACIKSHFLHTFILVRPLASASQIKMTFDMQQVRVSARIKRKPTRYEVSVVTRDEVGAYKPYLWEQSVFEKGPMFR